MDAVQKYLSDIQWDWTTAILPVVIIGVVLLLRFYSKAMKAGVPLVFPESVEKRRANGDDMLIIDVSTPEEFANGHIPGAINLPFDQVTRRAGDLSADQAGDVFEVPLVLTCTTGKRAMAAAQVFKKKGFGRIVVPLGGNVRWQKLNLPFLTGDAENGAEDGAKD